MRRTFFLLSAGLFMAHSAFAGSTYVGGAVGIHSTLVDKNLTYPLYTNSLTMHHFSGNYKGFYGQAFIGKQFNLSSSIRYAIQGDFDGFTNSANDNLNNYFLSTPAAVKERVRYGFGLFLLPQMKLNELVNVFAGPGIVKGQFVTSSGATGGTLGVTGNYNNWLTGWGIKVGIANRIKDNWDLLFTYQYNQYQRVTYIGLEPLSAEFLQATYRPENSLFSLGALYRFDRQTPVSNK